MAGEIGQEPVMSVIAMLRQLAFSVFGSLAYPRHARTNITARCNGVERSAISYQLPARCSQLQSGFRSFPFRPM